MCDSFGGEYESDIALCVDASCEQPGGGACCLPGGACVIKTDEDCDTAGGAFYAEGSTCEVGLCVPGSCCFESEPCDDVTATGGVGFKCIDAGGTFRAGVSCSPYDPCDEVPCCLDETCLDASTLTCNAQDGMQLPGLGTCEEDSCAVGACCYDPGECGVMIGYECTLEPNSNFFEDFDACDPDPCDVVACCKPGGLCEEISTAQCLADGGMPLDTDICVPDMCVAGACCYDDGECLDTVQYECDALAGTLVAGAICASDPCAEGACCYGGGVCLETIRGECDALMGTLVADATCDPDPCNVKACCKAGDVCEELTPADCIDEGGTPLDADICEPGICVAGACCYDGGTCGEMLQYACDDLSGTLLPGLTCDPDPCLVPALISSVPEDGLIDARQPHPLTSLTPLQGFSVIQVCFDLPVFDAGGEALAVDDFTLVETPEQVDPVPAVTAVVDLGGNCFEVQLERPITPGVWTTIIANVYSESGLAIDPAADRIDIGFLPGDVDGSGGSTAVDITILVDALNGVIVLPESATDIDRSGQTTPNDIIQEIEVLRGAETFTEWFGTFLPDQP